MSLNFVFDYVFLGPSAFEGPRFWNLIAAGVNTIGSMITNNQTNKANARIQREEREFEKSEREASQAYQTSERQASQVYQTSEREAQNDWSEEQYLKYSSPEAMARQYLDAGLNPALAVDSSSVGNVTAGSGSNGGAPSASAPSGASSPIIPHQGLNLAQGFMDITAGLKNLADAKNKGIDTEFLQKTLNDRIRKGNLEANAQEFMNSVGMRIHSMKELKEIEQIAIQMQQGSMEISYLREKLNGLVDQNRITRNEADHWLDVYQADMNERQNRNENIRADTSVKLASVKQIGATVDNLISSTHLNDVIARLTNLKGDQLEEWKAEFKHELTSRIKKLDAEARLIYYEKIARKLKNSNLINYGKETHADTELTSTIAEFGGSVSDLIDFLSR